jgi:16S rRNA (guanine527-N7)-methyltransferase
VAVSRETMERLEEYAALLKKWNPAINLVAPSTLADLAHRHIADSTQLWAISPQGATSWSDLGSGGGLPGIVVAILALEYRPSLVTLLIESDTRKSVFLQTVIRTLGLNASVVTGRIETATPSVADIVSARALAPLPKLLGLVSRHLSPTGVALLPKGQSYAEEIAQARLIWDFSVEITPSLTDTSAVILAVRSIARV